MAMADHGNDTGVKVRDCIFCLILLIVIVDGRGVDLLKNEKLKPEGTIKTIESEDGDVIDCVDILKQPAFKDPLLTNHTLEMKSYVQTRAVDDDQAENNELIQSWRKNEECPEGTIPILRTQSFRIPRRRSYPTILNEYDPDGVPPSHEFAQVSIVGGDYYGARATINVWNPSTNPGEKSIAQIWVLANHEAELNSIEAGWVVRNGEKKTRLFIYWTRDGYQSTGCYNLLCSGFVQTNKNIALGAAIEPVSKYGGKQYDIFINIRKFTNTDGNWWLQVGDQQVGYWPSSIFTHLATNAHAINWGGEIVNNRAEGRHTTTQMGSGHFPNEAFGKASYFSKLGYFDQSNSLKDPEKLISFVSRPACYDLRSAKEKIRGVLFYFGGPGLSKDCQ